MSESNAEYGGEPTLAEEMPHLVHLAPLRFDSPVLAGVVKHHPPLVTEWLGRNGRRRVADVLELTVDEIDAWPQIGVGKRNQILGLLSALNHSAVTILARAADLAGAASQEATAVDPSPPPLTDPELRLLASWGRYAEGASTWGRVERTVAGAVPADVAAALESLRERPVGETPALVPADDLLAAWIAGLDTRQQAILRGRLVQAPARTLQEIADEHDVTRERIRQIQQKITSRARELMDGDDWRSVRWEAFAVRQRFGAFAPLTQAEADDLGSESGFPRALIVWLAGYQRHGLTVVLDGFESPSAPSLPLADGGAVVDEAELNRTLLARGVTEGLLPWAADQIADTHRVDGRLVLWPRNIVDKACAVLEVRGVPMTPDELAEAIGGGINVRGLKDRLYQDERTTRATRATIGLRACGEEYTSVTDLMCQRLEQEGGLELAALAADLSVRFGVSATSIHVYAGAPVFVVEGGQVRLRQDDEPFVPRNEPRRVRGLYRDSSDSFLWHLVADYDLLRGSGRAMPQEIAVLLGLEPGSRMVLTNPVRDIPVSWLETSHTGPNIGSLKALAEAAGVSEDDVAMVRVSRTAHSLDLMPRGPEPTDEATVPERISWATGLPIALCGDRPALARVVGSRVSSVVDDLRRRGDDAVADLVDGLPLAEDNGEPPPA